MIEGSSFKFKFDDIVRLPFPGMEHMFQQLVGMELDLQTEKIEEGLIRFESEEGNFYYFNGDVFKHKNGDRYYLFTEEEDDNTIAILVKAKH